MLLFVFECLCCGGLGLNRARPAGPGLLAEGLAMLRAIVSDLARLDAVNGIATLVSDELEGPLRAISPKIRAESADARDLHAAYRSFDALVETSDRVLVIAPEIDGALLSLSERVLARGGRLLGCAPAGVRAAADKLECGRRLKEASVPTPPVFAWSPAGKDFRRDPFLADESLFPAVLRPRHGAGSIETFRVESAAELEQRWPSIRDSARSPEWVISPFVEGLPASASFIVTDSGAVALAPGEQTIERRDGSLHYRGGRLPLRTPGLCRRALELGRRAIDALPELGGFVGVDLILAGDPRDDAVLEVNPRLTTSYLGLRRVHAGRDLASLLVGGAAAGDADARTGMAAMRPVVFGPDESGRLRAELAP